MAFHSPVSSTIIAGVVVLLLACGKDDEPSVVSSTLGTSIGSESGHGDADLPSDEARPYGPCNEACSHDDEFDCAYCSADGGCADPLHEGPFTLCSTLCETAADCPAPPIDGDLLCLYGGCYMGCADAPCPEGQTCVFFVTVDDPPVCMYVG